MYFLKNRVKLILFFRLFIGENCSKVLKHLLQIFLFSFMFSLLRVFFSCGVFSTLLFHHSFIVFHFSRRELVLDEVQTFRLQSIFAKLTNVFMKLTLLSCEHCSVATELLSSNLWCYCEYSQQCCVTSIGMFAITGMLTIFTEKQIIAISRLLSIKNFSSF